MLFFFRSLESFILGSLTTTLILQGILCKYCEIELLNCSFSARFVFWSRFGTVQLCYLSVLPALSPPFSPLSLLAGALWASCWPSLVGLRSATPSTPPHPPFEATSMRWSFMCVKMANWICIQTFKCFSSTRRRTCVNISGRNVSQP